MIKSLFLSHLIDTNLYPTTRESGLTAKEKDELKLLCVLSDEQLEEWADSWAYDADGVESGAQGILACWPEPYIAERSGTVLKHVPLSQGRLSKGAYLNVRYNGQSEIETVEGHPLLREGDSFAVGDSLTVDVRKVFGYLMSCVSDHPAGKHNGVTVKKVELLLKGMQLDLEGGDQVEEIFIWMCKMSHTNRPSKDTLWEPIRQCLSIISVYPSSGVRPWRPSRTERK
jgi:hypothetical protein